MKILIADDEALLREALGATLEKEHFISTTVCRDVDQSLELLRERDQRFDVIVLDFNMPGMDGFSGLRKVNRLAKRTPIGVLSATCSLATARECYQKGASGFIPKSLGMSEVVSAIRLLALGEIYFPSEWFAMRHHLEENKRKTFGLSPRESEMLSGLLQGLSNKELALRSGLQEVTVKMHIRSVFQKLGAKNRTQAALKARDLDL